jgi:RNA-directed DNA polymerase
MAKTVGGFSPEEAEVLALLYIRQLNHLARHLGVRAAFLELVIEQIPSYCEELQLFDPTNPNKVRVVLNIEGPFRKLQDKMLRSVLLPKLQPSKYSHGGVTGRDIKTNVRAHAMSKFTFVTDISNFYPSVSHFRVYKLFADQFGCTPDVARACTRLCTYNHHLALGLPRSPILADHILRPVDHRIASACARAGLVYTRFVDDLAISGHFDLAPRKCGISTLITRILTEHGFVVNPRKHRFGSLSDDFAITKIRVHNGHLDVRREYFNELVRQIVDARSLGQGGDFRGPYLTEAQIAGRVTFVGWINPGRKRQLLPMVRSMSWRQVEVEAQRRGLIAAKKILRPMSKCPI